MKYELFNADCLEKMKDIPDKSIECVITDPPFGTTGCKWDSVIQFDKMWEQLNRIVNDSGAIVLFGSEPFSTHLRMSNIKHYKYDWIWRKNTSTGFQHAKNMPLKNYENISIFSIGSIGHKSLLGDKRMIYNPQGIKRVDKISKNTKNKWGNIAGKRPSHKESFITEYENYPLMVLDFNTEKKTVHPTQKPVSLLEYLIKTYTLKNETVLDFTMGSGSTGVACVNTNRNFIGIELDNNYFNIAKKRIEDAEKEKASELPFN